MAGYHLSREASDDLLAIFFTALEMFGYQQAETYRDGLERTFALLAEYPRMARIREEIAGAVRALPHKVHVIVYEIESDNRIFILRIRHSREDWLEEPV